MTSKCFWCCAGCVAAGALGAYIVMRNKEKIKPMAAELVAKSMRLKDKALDYAARTREHAEDIVAEARHINETQDSPADAQ